MQVAKALQAVCRPNPAKSRASCTRESKQQKANAAKETVATTAHDDLVELSSGSEVEILAMAQESGPSYGRG